jgi:hypothetical protein
MPQGVKGFQKGIVTNPKGRPPKERALTAILERAGAKSVEVDGKAVSGKQLVARMVWEGVASRVVSFPDGALMTLDADQWLILVKWVYAQIDGPPKQQMEVGGIPGSAPIPVHAVDYRQAIAPLAPEDDAE